MKVSEFKEFTRLWALSSLDPDGDVLTFELESGRLLVSFSGMHIHSTRSWPASEVSITGLTEGHAVSVAGTLLTGTLDLFSDDQDLEATLTGPNLSLKVPGRSARVRTLDKGTIWRIPEPKPEAWAKLDRAGLGNRLNMLAATAAQTLDRPALTGINVSPSGEDRLVLRSTDGHGRACMIVYQVEEMEGELRFTVPAADLSTAMGLCDRSLLLEVEGGRLLTVRDDRTVVRLSLLQGEYPTFLRLQRDFERKFVVPSRAVDTAVKAANILDSHKLVTLRVQDSLLSLRVADSERGDFEQEITQVECEDLEMHFDAEYLRQVASYSGVETVFNHKDSTLPVMISGDNWYYWLSPVWR